MKNIIIIILSLTALFINISCKENSAESVIDKPDVKPADNKFEDRTYNLFVPLDIAADQKLPLIFVFHGAYGNGTGMQRGTGFDDFANSNKFIVCYPDAATENWEEGCMCNKPYRLGIDDIGFVEYLIDTLSAKYNIDSERIFAAGYSQGGLFAQNVACKLSQKFKAVAAVASPMSVQLYQNCSPSDNISLLMIHGTNDGTLPFYGADAGTFSLVSTPSVFKLWGTLNDCNSEPEVESIQDNGDPNISVIKSTYNSCESNSKVVLYEVTGGGHNWFQSPDINATYTIVNFFLSF